MHELSVCQALLSEVSRVVSGSGARAVVRVTVEIGILSGIDCTQLASAFQIFRKGGCAAKADLVIESTPIVVECMACGARSAAAPNRLVCAACRGFRTRILAGREMRLRRVECEVC